MGNSQQTEKTRGGDGLGLRLPHNGAEALPGGGVPSFWVVDGETLVGGAPAMPSAAAHHFPVSQSDLLREFYWFKGLSTRVRIKLNNVNHKNTLMGKY